MTPRVGRFAFACLALLACSDGARSGQDASPPSSGGESGAASGSGGTRVAPFDAATGAPDAAMAASGRGGGGASTTDASTSDARVADAAVRDGGAMTDSGTTPADAGATGTPFVYVSGYGANIHVFELDPTSGALDERSTANGGDSPSYLAIAPDRRTLYAINESSPQSEVVAFAIDPSTGALSMINRASTGGEGSPHLAVHPGGKWVAVAHYGSGHVSVLPVLPSGGVGAPVAIVRGPDDGARRAHQAVFDRRGDFLFVPCLQSNYVLQLRFDARDGSLAYNAPATVAVTGGPRHMAFDPAERHAYVLSEQESTITSFDYDAATGTLSAPRVVPSFQSTKGASAHIAVHPSGRFLYASNRTENSLGVFPLDGDGRPGAGTFVREMIATPRDFTIDPTGTFLILANQAGSQNALVFRIDAQTGLLTRAKVVAVGDQPTFVGVVRLP